MLKKTLTVLVFAAFGILWIASPEASPQAFNPHGGVNANKYANAPWTSPGYRGYREPASSLVLINPAAAPVQPRKYEVYTHALPIKSQNEKTAELIAHVPEHAEVFIGNTLTTSKGDTRVFSSPALVPGYTYSYTVRVNWIEDGQKVTQAHDVLIKPGESSCFYLIEKGTGFDTPKEVVAAALAKLTPADRKLAEAQKFCAVQNGVLLGAMGAPTKIDVNGQPVFLCCAACSERARSDAAKTLAAVEQLKAKNAPAAK